MSYWNERPPGPHIATFALLAVIATALFILALSSCAPALSLPDPPAPNPKDELIPPGGGYRAFGPTEIVPPEWYEGVYQTMRECLLHAALTRRFEDITWLAVDSIAEWPPPLDRKPLRPSGAYVEQRVAIYIVWHLRNDPALVGHELGHFLVPYMPEADPRFRRCDPLVPPRQ